MHKKIAILISVFSFLYPFDLSVMYSSLSFSYKEYEAGKVIDRDTSSYYDMRGVKINYLEKNYPLLFDIFFEYHRGTTTYEGGTWSGEYKTGTNKGVFLYNLGIDVGILVFSYPEDNFFKNKEDYNYYPYSPYLRNFYSVTPLSISSFVKLGIGYRYWNRGKTDEPGDYNEIYKWPYIEADFYSVVSSRRGNEISLNFSYHKALNPKMKAYIGKGYQYDLGRTSGYRFSLDYKLRLGQNWGFISNFIYDYWHILESKPVLIELNDQAVLSYEPESKTKNYYISLGLFFDF